MTTPVALAVVSEQRCWTDRDGVAYGRKRMGAVSQVSAAIPCTLVAREAAVEVAGEIVLPGQAGNAVTPWPGDGRDFPVMFSTIASLWSTIGHHRATVVYCPGVLGTLAGMMALVRRRPVIVIAVGNPREALPEAIPGAVGQLASRVISGAMRLLCSRAAVARYVTRSELQRAYPPGPRTIAFGISDVGALPPGTVRSQAAGSLVALTVASLDQPYKGVAEVIEAIAAVRANGLDLRLHIAGTGRLRPTLERLAADRLGSSVTFLGHLTGVDLERQYSSVDCFVLPSWTEGLSRALVEAMAAGLPVVATDVGGVRELLEPHRVVRPRDGMALAAALTALIEDPLAWVTSSRHNIAAAQMLIARAAAEEPEFVSAVLSCVAAKA